MFYGCPVLHSDLANRWCLPHLQSNKNVRNMTKNSSLASGDFVVSVLVSWCAQTGSDIRDDQLFRNKFQTYFFSDHVEQPSDWMMFSFGPSSSFCFQKIFICEFSNTSTKYWKNSGKILWPNLACYNWTFSFRDPRGRRYQIFPNQNFSRLHSD